MNLTRNLARPLTSALVRGVTSEGRGARRGPELLPAANSGTWVPFGTGTQPTQDASGILFTAVSNSAGMHIDVALEDGATYEISGTISGLTGGSLRGQAYGATTAHLGQSAAISANGAFTLQVTTSAAGSFANRFRLLANGTGTTNSYRVTAISLKKVLS